MGAVAIRRGRCRAYSPVLGATALTSSVGRGLADRRLNGPQSTSRNVENCRRPRLFGHASVPSDSSDVPFDVPMAAGPYRSRAYIRRASGANRRLIQTQEILYEMAHQRMGRARLMFGSFAISNGLQRAMKERNRSGGWSVYPVVGARMEPGMAA